VMTAPSPLHDLSQCRELVQRSLEYALSAAKRELPNGLLVATPISEVDAVHVSDGMQL
jgi:hypothetical protein